MNIRYECSKIVHLGVNLVIALVPFVVIAVVVVTITVIIPDQHKPSVADVIAIIISSRRSGFVTDRYSTVRDASKAYQTIYLMNPL